MPADHPGALLRLKQRGSWPGAVSLRRGWALCVARPWNDEVPAVHLRLVRGGAGFLEACARELRLDGSDLVLSPPLPPGTTEVWKQAGFVPHLTLDLFQRDLLHVPPEPSHPVTSGSPGEWPQAVEIDNQAFSRWWRLGATGLVEARNATSTSDFLTVRDEAGILAGFAIVGIAASTSYLQRVAVRPRHQGRGYGRSLVRASLQWARQRGARTMLLNTQPENEAAATLYASEAFTMVAGGLEIWRYDRRRETAAPGGEA